MILQCGILKSTVENRCPIGVKPIFLSVFMLLFCLCPAQPAVAGDKGWIEIRSQHFRVLSDGSDKDARRMAREFEQMRAVFSREFPKMRLDSGAPLLVLAARDQDSMKNLSPGLWKIKGAKPAGLFRHGWEKSFALVRLDTVSSENYEVIYHEYTHSLIHMNFRLVPVWLDEGLADFFANTRFLQKKIYIGAPSRRTQTLLAKPLIPMDTFLSVTHRSPYYHDEDKVFAFYAEAWALTHFLMISPEMERGKRLGKYIDAVQAGEDQKKAFAELIGDPNEIQKKLEQYIRQFSMQAVVMDTPPHTDEAEFTSRRLSQPETDAELSTYHLWEHDNEGAQKLLESALKADDNLAVAHENMGFLHFAEGRDQEAAREFARAYELDHKLYLSLFYRSMLSPMARSAVAADQDAFGEDLLKVVELNKDFAPAYIQYALLKVRQGDLDRAFGIVRRAEQLEPSRAGYHILGGYVLLGMGRGTEASGFAKYVADRWESTDHNEAVDLWNAIPAAQRPAGVELELKAPDGTTTIHGKIKTTICGGKEDPGLKVVLDHDGQLLTFRGNGRWISGFADTLWYGEDHFTLCHHVSGMQAVISYRPSDNKAFAGDLAEVELREDLPPLSPVARGERSKPEASPQSH